jgi:hypothetical protein
MYIGAPGYKPKQGGIGKGLRLFSEELINAVLKEAGEMLDLFGYHISHNNQVNVDNNDVNHLETTNNHGNVDEKTQKNSCRNGNMNNINDNLFKNGTTSNIISAGSSGIHKYIYIRLRMCICIYIYIYI